jgi:hypothetical protein
MYSDLNCHNVGKHTRVLPRIVTVQCDFHWYCARRSFESMKVNAMCVSGNRYSKCYCVASVTETFTLKGGQTIHRSTPYGCR